MTEPKKNGKRRWLLVEPEWLIWSQRHMSLANSMRWRERCQPQTDALFPRPDGQAFASKEAMRRFVDKHVKPCFPDFSPYDGRRRSVNARLVEWCHPRGGFDYDRVAKWHGHESVNMTRNEYENDAELYQRLYGDGWLRRAFEKRSATAQAPVRGRANAGSSLKVERPGAFFLAILSGPVGIRTPGLQLRRLTPYPG